LIMKKRKIKLFLSKHKLQLVHTLLKSFDNFRMNTGMHQSPGYFDPRFLC
jgi:hypothetical protein